MDSQSLNLDRVETEILRRAHDIATTKRRIWISVIAPLALATLVLIAFWDGRQPQLLLWLFVVYVLATMLERVGYGMAVLLYKRVIRKLAHHIDRTRASGEA